MSVEAALGIDPAAHGSAEEELRRGWRVGDHVVRVDLPLWIEAAGLSLPELRQLPELKGPQDMEAVGTLLDRLDLRRAVYLGVVFRQRALVLAQEVLIPYARAIEAALEVAAYSHSDHVRVCRVAAGWERTLTALAAMALARHAELTGEEPEEAVESFDLGPWRAAREALIAAL